MITQVYSKDGSSLLYYGKSTDTKPVKDQNDPTSKDPPNGSVFYEMDTSSAFMFDGEDKEWIKQTGGAIPPGYVKPEGTKEIDANGTGIDVTEYKYVDVNTTQPSGTKQISITQNGTTTEDVSAYADAKITVNTLPAKGLVFEDYDSDGYPHSARFVGAWTEIPDYFLDTYFTLNNNGKKITTIQLPAVSSIGIYAFSVCRALKSMTIPDTVNEISSGCFKSCSNLETVVLQCNGNIVIGAESFDGCGSLERVYFAGNVTRINKRAFVNSKKVLLDFSNNTTIPTLVDTTALNNLSTVTFRIPYSLSDESLGTGNGWQSATNWVIYTNVTWEVV